jgi:exopolysaccharide biosynthesis protein
MKRHFIIQVYLLAVLAVISGEITAQTDGFKKIIWGKEKIAPGLVWKSSHTILNDSVPQNINILIVNLNKRKIFIQYDPEKNTPVSKQAASINAIAAVNGGFFNIKNGGSVTYIRTGGRIVDADTAKKWSRNANMTGSVLIQEGSELLIIKSMPDQWYNEHTDYDDVLVTGPLLVENAALVKLPETSLVTTRHPRTAIGKRNNKRILLITLDGRTKEAAGMTLNELAALMISLKCRDAINLDGGGSTTMWINGKPFSGVVNMPCDNKQFDHYGERSVSDILIIK